MTIDMKANATKSKISTRITDLLGIEHPIIQGAMGWVSFPPLVAAVSNAGGLGILATAFMPVADLRRHIRETKELTDRPFGVNLIPDSPDLEQQLDIIVAEKVPVANYGIGDPKRIIERVKGAGIIAMPTVGALKHAVKAEQDGADAVIVQGTEAGGHSSRVATVVLVPLVVDHVRIPVVAAGGFADGRGLAAALALGAEGISMGTRFIATQESPVPPNIKQRILNATEEDTIVTGHLTGIRCRILKNKLAEGFV
ncbi:MAG: nitronate monooxygenase, partial [Dehalococcoidia bacterium]|nr:nitronate monooxygenase [Dehalococcoidia bacterium]